MGKFLLGTKPQPESLFSTISQFKELESNGALSRGPLDLQYANYLKSVRSGTARSAKQARQIVSAMRDEKALLGTETVERS